MDLDLGSKSVMNVKVGGKEYSMSAPTVAQTEKYQKSVAGDDADQTGGFVDFLAELGMPEDISRNLDVVQMRKLSEGLLSLVEKK